MDNHRGVDKSVALIVAGAIVGAGLIISLAPSVQKTYGALEVANNWTAQQQFSGGINVTGGIAGLKTAADCTILSCTATGQVCVTGLNLCMCNVSSGLYECAGSSASTLSLTPLAQAPATCSPGQMFHLTNGAICHCYAANSMENIGSQGVCQ